jgi:ABC-2 type transport system permease protein
VSPLATVRLVAEREIRRWMRSRVLYVSTVVIVLAIFAIAVINRIASGDDEPRSVTVAVAGDAPAGLDAALAAVGPAFDMSIEPESVSDVDEARQLLTDGDVDAAIDTDGALVLFADEEDDTVGAALQQAWAASEVRQSLADEGVPPERIDAALSPQPLTSQVVDVDGDGPDGLNILVGTLSGILLFMSIQMFGNMILMGVVEEKSTAVIEVLLARVKASHLLAGKVLGIGTVAVAQLVVVVIAGVGALAISGVDVPGDVWAALPWTAVWFIAGFTLYAFLFALAGSMVSRQEDATAAATPVSLVLTASYLGVFVLVGVADSTAARVLSLIPLFTPLLMPMRIAAGAAPWYDIVLALVIVAVTIVLIARLSGRIYNALVLRRGSRVRWADALRSA